MSPPPPLQMAYLALNGLAQAVMTEDSDLLCYGCPTVSAGGGSLTHTRSCRLASKSCCPPLIMCTPAIIVPPACSSSNRPMD